MIIPWHRAVYTVPDIQETFSVSFNSFELRIVLFHFENKMYGYGNELVSDSTHIQNEQKKTDPTTKQHKTKENKTKKEKKK